MIFEINSLVNYCSELVKLYTPTSTGHTTSLVQLFVLSLSAAGWQVAAHPRSPEAQKPGHSSLNKCKRSTMKIQFHP